MTFSFIQNPTGQAMTDGDLVTSALDQPMSLGSTFWDQAKGGVLESFGLGTAIRESQLPAEAPTTPDLTITPADGGEPIRVPDTPQMRRRITAFESVNPQSLQSRPESPQELQQRQNDAGALSEDAYKASPSFRKDIPWQNGMTQERAAALAEQDDTRKIREFYGQKRPVTAFFGNLAGQAVDPINYIPIAGEAVAGANIARFGRIAGRALTSSLDAAANTALAGIATAEPRGQLGDDVSWQSTVSQIAMAALIGGAFGALHGRFGRATPEELRVEAGRKLATLDNVQASRVSLNDALDGMIRDSEVNLSPASTEFVAKAADQDLPKVVIARMAREADPEAHQRLETLNRTFDINEAEIRKLQSQTLDNKAYGPTRAAIIQADELAGRLQKAEEAIAAAPSDKEKALATTRRDTARQELRDHLSTIDDAKVQEIEAIDEQLSQRRTVQEPVAAERAQLKQKTDQLFTAARDQYWQNRFADPATQRAADGQEGVAAIAEPVTPQRASGGQQRASIDTSAPVEPVSPSVIEAVKRVGKPEGTKALAEQYRVNPETGEFPELADIEQLRTEGRLTEDDLAALDDADEIMKTANAYGEALKSFASCVI
ncbi:hypothetical protein ACVIRO_002330 [Rhizobium ruizarguesonis]